MASKKITLDPDPAIEKALQEAIDSMKSIFDEFSNFATPSSEEHLTRPILELLALRAFNIGRNSVFNDSDSNS